MCPGGSQKDGWFPFFAAATSEVTHSFASIRISTTVPATASAAGDQRARRCACLLGTAEPVVWEWRVAVRQTLEAAVESRFHYGDVTVVVRQGALGDGLGARVWVGAHILAR
jgi:hypothetical protein